MINVFECFFRGKNVFECSQLLFSILILLGYGLAQMINVNIVNYEVPSLILSDKNVQHCNIVYKQFQ